MSELAPLNAEAKRLSELSPNELKKVYQASKDNLLLNEAKNGDFSSFCEYSFNDTHTGKRWEIYDYQREWIELLENENRLVIFAPMQSGKSEFISVAYPVWCLGQNPNELIITVSDTDKQAVKFLSAGSTHITSNEKVGDIFPNLEPMPHTIFHNRPKKWSEERGAVTVKRDFISPHPSWQAIGSLGAVLGSRATKIIIDDIIDFENSRSVNRQQQIIEWIDSELMSRLFDTGQIVFLGTSWVEFDVMHEFSKRHGFKSVRYSVEPEDVRDGFRLVSNPQKSAYIQMRKAELSPSEYDRQFRNRTRKKDDVMFPSVQNCFRFLETDDMRNINDILFGHEHGSNLSTRSGVDLSSSKRPGTAIVIGSESKQSSKKLRTVFHVQFGQWTSPQTSNMIQNLDEAHGVDIWTVENNGYQEALKEWMDYTETGVSITSFTTGKEKADPDIGLPSLEAEFYNGDWSILLPSHTRQVVSESSSEDCDCDCCRFALELVNYPHYRTTDGVMALWFMRGRKQRKKRARARVIDTQTGEAHVPLPTLAAYRIGNRISKSRGYTPPPDIMRVVSGLSGLSIKDAQERLDGLKNKPSLTGSDKNLANLLEDMIYYCKAISA